MKDEIKGKAEEIKGKVTGDRPEEMKGKLRQTADKARRAARDLRGDLNQETERMREREDDAVESDRSR